MLGLKSSIALRASAGRTAHRCSRIDSLHNKSRTEIPSPSPKRSSHFECQSLSSPTVHNGGHKDKDVIVNLQTVPEAFTQRPKLFHLRHDMFYHDAHTGQLSVHQLLILCQGTVSPRLVGGSDTMEGQILMQTVKASVCNYPDLLRNPHQDTRFPKMSQVVDRTGGRGRHRANQPLFIHDQTVLNRVTLLLARVERPLTFRISRTLYGLLRPIQNGEQVRGSGQNFGQTLPLPPRRRVGPKSTRWASVGQSIMSSGAPRYSRIRSASCLKNTGD